MTTKFSPMEPPAFVRIKGASPHLGPRGEFFGIVWADDGWRGQPSKLVIWEYYADEMPDWLNWSALTPRDAEGDRLLEFFYDAARMSLHTDEDYMQIGALIEADEKMGDATP